MYQVGANNPNVGNDRRKGLIDQLQQQLAQRFAQLNSNSADQLGAMPFGRTDVGGMYRRRAQVAQATAPARAANAGRPTAGTAITGMNNIPSFVSSLLGVGARANPQFLSPNPGVPVQGVGPINHPGPPAGTPVPYRPANPVAPPAAPSTANPVPASVVQTAPAGQPVSGPAGSPTNPYGFTQGTVMPTNPDAGLNAAAQAYQDAGAGAPQTALGGLVNLGNGTFLNPTSGQIFGMNTLPMGSLVAHLAAGRA